MKSGKHWPLIIVGLLLFNALAMVGLILISSRDRSEVVDDYYQKAVDWDQTMAQARRNVELGWTLDVADTPRPDGVHLLVAVRDAGGAPVAATVRLDAFHQAHLAEAYRVELRPLGDGRYEAVVPNARPGLWQLHFQAERQDERFTAMVRRDLAPALGGAGGT